MKFLSVAVSPASVRLFLGFIPDLCGHSADVAPAGGVDVSVSDCAETRTGPQNSADPGESV